MTRNFLIKLALGFLLLFAISPYDLEGSLALHAKDHDWAYFMKRSVFENSSFGGSDIPVILQILALLILIIVEILPKLKNRFKFNKELQFICMGSIGLSVILIHGLKIIFGRPRPFLLLKFPNTYHFSHWWELAYFSTNGMKESGSFPSGHTASAMFMLAFVYALQNHTQNKALIVALKFFVFIYAFIMGLSRVMLADHWITDCVGSILLTWAVLHFVFYRYFAKATTP